MSDVGSGFVGCEGGWVGGLDKIWKREGVGNIRGGRMSLPTKTI